MRAINNTHVCDSFMRLDYAQPQLLALISQPVTAAWIEQRREMEAIVKYLNGDKWRSIKKVWRHLGNE